jgi:hypothetical protein
MTVLIVILSIIVILALLILIVIGVNKPRNVKAMNSAVDQALKTVQKYAPTEEIPCGEYSKLTLKGIMKFQIHQYRVKDIGNLSVMTMNAGLMQMSTFILTPKDKDLPLVSTDYMYILGKRTSYLECYDLVLDKGKQYEAFLDNLKKIKKEYADLDTVTPSSSWYDDLRTVGIYMSGKPADDAREEKALVSWVQAVMEYAAQKPLLSEAEKNEKLPVVEKYTNGLIEQGGVSTDFFVKSLGAEKTRDFFEKVLFGTKAE